MATYTLNVSLVDAYGRPASKRYDIVAATQPDAVTLAGNFMADLAGITGLRILSYVVGEKVTYTDVVTAASNRDAGATFSVRTQDNEKATVKVPGPIADIFNTDGTIDLTDGAVTAFMSEFLAGNVLVDDGEVVTEVISGRLDT